MKTIHDLLADHSFFSPMDKETIALIAGCGKNVHFKPNQYIAKQGDAADQFYVIRNGRVAIEMHHPTQGKVIIKTMADNDIVGVSWIIPPYKYQFDMRAIDHTSAVEIEGKCIRPKCEDNPKMGYALMKSFAGLMIKRLDDTRMQLLDVYSH